VRADEADHQIVLGEALFTAALALSTVTASTLGR
jgi:hypothetical protein